MFCRTPYRTARELHNDVSLLPIPSTQFGSGARALTAAKAVTPELKIAARRAILKMQRLIVALCLSAAAALVPNSAAARSSSNAKAPLKVD